MSAHYTPITLCEMSELLKKEKGWNLNRPSVTEECFYDYTVKAIAAKDMVIFIRVYSSIPGNEVSRDVGADAIRVCILAQLKDRQVGIRGFSRVYRTQGWRDNLRERVLEALEFAKTKLKLCKCGSIMVVRKARKTGNQFYGCSQYPACMHTEAINV